MDLLIMMIGALIVVKGYYPVGEEGAEKNLKFVFLGLTIMFAGFYFAFRG